MSEVNSNQIKMALAKMHGNREFFMTEVKNGPTMTGLLQFDAVAIYKSWSRPQIRGYEIKVSRSDFLRDNKYSRYLPYFHEFYFVVPSGMVQRQEVEENIGLIWYNPQTGSLTTKRKAVWRDIEIDAAMLLYIIMNRLESDRLPFHSTQTEFWREWLEGKRSDRELGYQVRSKLVTRLNVLERENNRYSNFKEALEERGKIVNIMRKYGLSTWDIPDALDAALSHPYPVELDRIRAQLTLAVQSIDKLKEEKEV